MSSNPKETYQLSSDKNDYMEATKLVNDWSKWMVTIETASIIVIGGFVKDLKPIDDLNIKFLIVLSISSFMVSIVAATSLLIALPGAAQRFPPPSGTDLGDMSSPRSYFQISIRHWGSIQQIFFLLGLLSFGCLIIYIL